MTIDIVEIDSLIRTCNNIIEQLNRMRSDENAYAPMIQSVKLSIDIGVLKGKREERKRIRNQIGL